MSSTNKVYVDSEPSTVTGINKDESNDSKNEVPTKKTKAPAVSVMMFEDDEFYKKWGGSMIIGPFVLAVFSLIVIITGEITLTTWKGSCGYSLTSFISASIAISYLFLLVFSWVYLGDKIRLNIPFFKINRQILAPFTSLKWIMIFYLIIAVVSFIVWIVGCALLSLSVFCSMTAPVLYSYTLFLVVSYALSAFIVVGYILKLKFGNSIMSLVKEQMRQPSQEELEERIFRKKFAEFDKDMEYKISSADMPPLLQILGVYVPEEEIPALTKTLDRQNTGFIEFDDLFAWFRKINGVAGADGGRGEREEG